MSWVLCPGGMPDVPSCPVDDPVGGFVRAPVATAQEATADLVGGWRRWLFWACVTVAVICGAVGIFELVSPLDVRLLPDPRLFADVALVGSVALLAAVALSRLRVWVKAVAVATAAAVVFGLMGFAALALLTGGNTAIAEEDVPGTATTVAILDQGFSGDLLLVLRGDLGPFSRQKVIMDTAGCHVWLGGSGDRSIEIQVGSNSAGSQPCEAIGDYLVVVGDDGWSTSVERVG